MYTPVHELVAAHALAGPDRVAVVRDGVALTYGELNSLAQRLARRLIARGVRPETPVGVLLDRSAEFVLAALAVLKAAGAYVPCGLISTELVITARTLDGDGPVTPGPLPTVRPGNLACVLAPRVAVPHAGITRLVHDPAYVSLNAGESVLHASPVTRDTAAFEIWGALANGARLVVAPPGRTSPGELGALLREERVTTAFLSTWSFHRMVEERLPDLAGLRQVLTRGGVLSPAHARTFVRAHPRTALINVYGAAEMTAFVTSHLVSQGAAATILIGRPIDGTRVRVLDENLNPATTGHLYAGGPGLARGYHGDPAMTAARFVPDPRGRGERLFATGALVRVLSGGAIELLGHTGRPPRGAGDPGGRSHRARRPPRALSFGA
ncbi:AMP-binding protein [Nonomuraea endophytica]|uniref:Non-ribosomal peptide synthetase component F n=1 Tax=Nonomuraea endophytica TaxID=714136 RepID=A0A7W8A0G3_9ACTN|nr:AMP-binding protein [Nonomuraea endophytica]MBB5076729.1 non-ribosomal peptide synthetase component F [Nonomuraea endophytica]